MAYPISDVPRRIVYSGSAGVGPYAFTFEVLANTDIAVYKNTTLLTLTTDYTVSINAGTGTGTVTLVVAATGSDTVTLVGDRAIQRTSDFVTGGDLFASTLNDELDSLTIAAQQVDEKADRAMRARVTDPTTLDMTLPAYGTRATKLLGFTASGAPTVSTSTVAQIDAAVSSFVNATGNNASSILYTPAGTGAVATTVQAKLRESVSVLDFGADPTGVADSTAAIQAAITYCVANGKDLFFPAGSYNYDSGDVTFTIDLIAAGQQGFRMFGESHNSKILCRGNGVLFNVNCATLDPVAPFFLEHLYFQHVDYATDTNATLFYVYRKPTPGGAAYWGARMHAYGCYFRRFTYAAVHGIMLTNSSFRDCYFYGINSADFVTYNDAGVRLWGGEGATATGATFSNLVEFDTCTFRLVRKGIQIISGLYIAFKNCTFDPCWCSIEAYGPEGDNFYGTQNSIVVVSDSWFEDQMPTYTTKWYITNRRISFPAGADNGTSISTIVTGERNFFSVAAYVKPSCLLTSYANTVRAELQGGGSDIVAGRNFFEGQAKNISGGVDATYYEFGADRASVIPPVVIGNAQPRFVGTVGSTSVYSKLEVEDTTAAGGASFVRNNSASGTGPFVTLGRTRGSSNGAVTVVQANDYLGRIDFAGADGVDLYSIGASISAVVDGTPGSNDMPGRLSLWTTPDGSDASVERVRVNSTGSVRFVGLASAPAGPTAGDVYYDTGTNKLRCYNGTTWNDLF